MPDCSSMLNIWRWNTIRNLVPCQSVYQRRSFFTANKKKEYHGRKLVGYSMKQMYGVVSDVGNYKRFVPFCKKSLVLVQSQKYLKAELEIGFPPIIESYTSNVTLAEPYWVGAKCTDGTLFEFLENDWKFSPGLKSNPNSCIIDFYVNFQFRSVFHTQVAHMFFEKLVSQMEWAFITEAKRRYGPESLPSHALATPKLKS